MDVYNKITFSGIALTENGQLQMSSSIIHMSEGFQDKQMVVQIEFKNASTPDPIGVINVTGTALGLRGIHSAANAIIEKTTFFLSGHNFADHRT